MAGGVRVAGNALALIAASAAAAIGAPAASSAAEPSAATFALSSNGRIYLMGADGTGRRPLRTGLAPALDQSSYPSWSPDGQRLVFSAGDVEREELPSVRVINVDGTGERRLTPNGSYAFTPSFSPDGQSIAFARFSRSQRNPTAGIVVMRSSGSRKRRLTRGTFDYTPAWSPDGGRIAFTRVRFNREFEADYAVYVINSDGTRQRRLVRDAQFPTWSPDGKRIAFVTDRDHHGRTCFDEEECAPNSEIYVMNADGTGQTRLTVNRADDQAPAWSPDGRQIAFTSNRAFRSFAGYEAYVMDSNSGCVRRLTNTSSATQSVAWRLGSAEVPATDCGGALVAAREPLVETDLTDEMRFRRFQLYFLGPVFGSMLLTDADADEEDGPVTFDYGDCGLLVVGACGRPLDVTVQSICDRHPFSVDDYDSPVRFRRPTYGVARGALVAHYGRRDVDIYAGGSAIQISGSPSEVAQMIASLRTLSGTAADALGPPRFPRSLLRELARARRAVSRFGSSMSAARQLHMTRTRVLQDLRLQRALRRFGRLGSTNC